MIRSLCGIILLALVGGCAPANLTLLKDKETAYYKSGRYLAQFDQAAAPALRYLKEAVRHARPGEKLAIVFDLDETCLSNWTYLQHTDYSTAESLFEKWARQSDCAVLPATHALYQEARNSGVNVFFISGRREILRQATERNLARAGYPSYGGLYLKPMNYDQPSVVPYKSASRRAIEARGYTILLSIGDQWSDLAGGSAKRTFKLPNPFYYIP
ncbi:HAD family acid phosphatase [soil metagenome]